MNSRRSKFTLFVLMAGLCCIASLAANVAAQENIRVGAIFLKADVGKQYGLCPLPVKFNGYISARGRGTVKYTFTRSDGATAPVYSMYFDRSGTKPVSTDWILGDASALPYYQGWQALKIVSPVELESSHSTGAFAVSCAQPSKDLDAARAYNNFRVTYVSLKPDLAKFTGRCPVLAKFTGYI